VILNQAHSETGSIFKSLIATISKVDIDAFKAIENRQKLLVPQKDCYYRQKPYLVKRTYAMPSSGLNTSLWQK